MTIAWNFSYHLEKETKSAVQRPIRPIVNATMLRQRWNMFGKPTQTESWFVYRGELQSGEVVDIFHGGGPVQMEKPADLSSMYANHRWRKLNVNLCTKRFRVHRQAVADFHCRRWNELQPPERQIVSMQLYRLTEKKDAPQECSCTLCLTITPDRESLAERDDGSSDAPDLAATRR